jgi:ECF sigma factor
VAALLRLNSPPIRSGVYAMPRLALRSALSGDDRSRQTHRLESELVRRGERHDGPWSLLVYCRSDRLDGRYFGGLTIEETAAVLGISDATVVREWTIAKAWLRAALSSR